MGESEQSKHDAFLADLRELTIKHGIEIGGCGCCGAPWLENAPSEPERGFYVDDDRLRFVHPSDKYDWEKYGKGGELPEVVTFTQSPEHAVRLSKEQMESLAAKGEWSESFTVTDSNLDIPVGAVIELPEAVEGEMTTKYAIARAAGNPGCGARLAKGQWWGFCGETDMGQSMPALCEQCGGEYKRAPGALPDPQLAPRRAGPKPLTAAEVTEPGWYWYLHAGRPAVIVAAIVGDHGHIDIWPTAQTMPTPADYLTGTFIGPISPPRLP